MRRAAGGALVGAAIGVLFWVDPGWSTAGETGKRGFLVAAALLLALLAILDRQPGPTLPRWLHALALSDLLLRLLSASFALHPWPAWLGGAERGLGIVDALAWWTLVYASARCAHRDLRWLALCGGALALAAACALLPWPPAFGGRPYGTFGNPAFLAGALGLAAPLLLCAPVPPRLRAALLLALAVMLLVLGARAAILAAATGVAVAAWRRWPGRPAVLAAGVLVLVSVALAALIGAAPDRAASGSLRALLYRSAVSAPLQPEPLVDVRGQADPAQATRIWIGHGPEGIEPLLTRQRDAAMNALESQGWDRLADRSHNRLLDRWLEFGLVGVLLGLALGLLPLFAAWTASGANAALRAGAFGAWVAFGVDGTFSVPSAVLDLGGALVLGLLATTLLPSRVAAGTTCAARWPFAGGCAAVLLLGPLCGMAHRWMLWGADSQQPGVAHAAEFRTQPYSALPALAWLEHARTIPPEQHPLALALAEHAVRAAPALPRAWHDLAHWRRKLGDQDGADAADIESALLLAEASDSPSLLIPAALGALRRAQSTPADLHRARRLLERIPVDARSAAWFRSHAFAAALLGDLAAARASYRQALQLDASDTASRRNLERLGPD
ncbi:MAG TPA: hypothetical protein VN259_00225 [Xanthomonadales bacterium]|nr:hypothetical protein [Xanthomonadales bacterium]